MNPLYPDFLSVWQDRRYSLEDFGVFAYGGIARQRRQFPQLARKPSRRRSRALFDAVRIIAYREVRLDLDKEAFIERVMGVASEANPWFPLPLTHRAVQQIAFRIADSVWNHRFALDTYTDRNGIQRARNRGALSLSPMAAALTWPAREKLIRERKRMGALFTAARKRRATTAGIETARRTLSDRGEEPTATSVSRMAGISERTVYRYGSLSRSASSRPPAARPATGNKRNRRRRDTED